MKKKYPDNKNKMNSWSGKKLAGFGAGIRKTIIIFLSFSLCFSFSVPSAQAILADVTSITGSAATGAMDNIMDDLGVDKTELKNMVNTINVARKKIQQPQVSISFNPANPVPGQKVTAVATPMYFLNTDKDLYFTWYLKPDGCPETNNASGDKKEKCDLDDDGDIDINDYKIKAARLIANNDFEWNKSGTYSEDNDNDGYSAVWGGNDQKGKNNYCYIQDTNSGDQSEIDCNRHLFADTGDTDDNTGDGSFGLGEEKFWHTNPKDPDTADTGNGDEANIVGLGINSFSWTYTEGDEVGVAVEGISIEPTQKSDSSYKIMIALLNNKCDLDYSDSYPKETILSTTVTPDTPMAGQTTTVTVTEKEDLLDQASAYGKITTYTTTRTVVTDSVTGAVISDTSSDSAATTSYSDISTNYHTSNITQVSDINKCLTQNLIDPETGGGAKEKMGVELSYSPDFPMNDPTAGGYDGDLITVNSSVLNAQNNGYLNYSWQVYKSDEANPDDWGSPLTKTQLKNSTQTSGMGANSFSFRLNFSDTGSFFLKVKLTVKENVSSKSTREGYSYVVIPVTSANEKIKIYNSTVSSSASGSPLISMGSTELCSSGLDKSICPVVKDQIIGLKVPSGSLTDFSWTINGQSFNYSTCFFEGCNPDKQTGIAFFPVLNETGSRYEVTLTATDLNSGKKINLSRYFQVVEPEVKIASANESTCQPVLLGHYIDYDGKEWPDWSTRNFQAIAGEKIKLSANFIGFIPDGANYGWIVDGVGVNINNAGAYGYEINDQNELVIPAKALGETTNVGLSALYFPDTLTKKALNAYWGVNYGSFYETEVGSSIDITSVDSLSGSQSAKSKSNNKILASLFSSTPTYLAFLFRITLTGMLLLFISGFIVSFFPKIKPGSEI